MLLSILSTQATGKVKWIKIKFFLSFLGVAASFASTAYKIAFNVIGASLGAVRFHVYLEHSYSECYFSIFFFFGGRHVA